MTDKPLISLLAARMATLKAKDKEPNSGRVLDTWLAKAENQLGADTSAGRLGWLIASCVSVAAVQRAVDNDGRKLFLLKGGTLLQHRLNAPSRTTSDIDGLIRGDIEDFLANLDDALGQPWGPFTLRRGPVEIIDVPNRVLKPRRLNVYLELRATTWRKVQLEIAPNEAGIGEESEAFQPPSLEGFGLPSVDALVGIAMRHQIAQKLHAVSDPHDPPTSKNDRPRDVVDLLLLRDLAAETGSPSNVEIAEAAQAVFASRANEAIQLGFPPRHWPSSVIAHPHWGSDYNRAAQSARFPLSLEDAVAELNTWIAQLCEQ